MGMPFCTASPRAVRWAKWRPQVASGTPLVNSHLQENYEVVALWEQPDAQAYLAEHGAPESLDDLRRHAQLAAENQSTWRLEGPEGAVVFRARSRVRTNSSEVARELVLAGAGIALRSTWDVGEELRDGRLLRVLPQYAGASDVAIFALTAGRARAENRVRAFVEFLAGLYGDVPEWDI